MPDRIEKALRKLSDIERKQLEVILRSIQAGNFLRLDVKKLKGRDDLYRVRKGDMRVLFRKTPAGEFMILAIERRSDTTYNKI